jgi:hypothetical protein
MAIGRISGPLLKSNLVRDGVDLAFETDLLYLDVTNSRIGVNTATPTTDLDVNGTIRTTNLILDSGLDVGNLHLSGNTISSDLTTISFVASAGEATVYHTIVHVDDIQIQGNVISTFNSNANLEFHPNGTGIVDITGNTNILGNLTVTGNITGNVDNVATQTTGSWTLATGTNTVSLTVPINGTYSIWVRGNIPNGIVTYTATAVVTNTNVPVLGSSYGWYYAAGNALVLTSIPTQFVGTVNNISNAVVSTTTANVFTFGITNNSGANAVVNWGYTKL